MGTLLVLVMMFGSVMIGSAILVIASRLAEGRDHGAVNDEAAGAAGALAAVDLRDSVNAQVVALPQARPAELPEAGRASV